MIDFNSDTKREEMEVEDEEEEEEGGKDLQVLLDEANFQASGADGFCR